MIGLFNLLFVSLPTPYREARKNVSSNIMSYLRLFHTHRPSTCACLISLLLLCLETLVLCLWIANRSVPLKRCSALKVNLVQEVMANCVTDDSAEVYLGDAARDLGV